MKNKKPDSEESGSALDGILRAAGAATRYARLTIEAEPVVSTMRVYRRP